MERVENYVEKDKVEAIQEQQERDTIERARQQKEMDQLERRNQEIKSYETASEKLRQNEWLKSEEWKNKDEIEKRVALERAGRDLCDTYKNPAPDLFMTEEEKSRLGSYNDEDWRININKEGETRCGGKLFGDDPREALHTYCHEYRHSYQMEQALRYKKGLGIVDNPEKAKGWAENYSNYIEPPKPELAKVDPERYRQEYEKYINQPVEKDANQFADEIIRRVYSPESRHG